MLSKQGIQEFQQIYLKTYGKKLSFSEATEQAHQLIRLCKFLLEYELKNQTTDLGDE